MTDLNTRTILSTYLGGKAVPHKFPTDFMRQLNKQGLLSIKPLDGTMAVVKTTQAGADLLKSVAKPEISP